MLSVAAKGAHYDEISNERIRERTVERKEELHVSRTLSAYYQVISAPKLCENASAAPTYWLSNVFRETSIFHFTGKYTERRPWEH